MGLNAFVSLPIPAAPGTGASVDVSSLAALKNAVQYVSPNGLGGQSYNLEASADGGVSFDGIDNGQFDGNDSRVVNAPATHMRIRRTGPLGAALGVITISAATVCPCTGAAPPDPPFPPE